MLRHARAVLKRNHVGTLFCATFPQLVPFYGHLGMRPYAGPFIDPEFGPLYSIAGDVNSPEMVRLLEARYGLPEMPLPGCGAIS
jgi:hypothetical protein